MRSGCPPKPWRRRTCFGGFRRRHQRDRGCKAVGLHILRALEAKKDLNRLTAEDVMAKDRIAVTENTSIDEAVKIMEDKRLLNLPVRKNGKVAYSITRHDLLRAWIGLGVSIEDQHGS